MDTNQKIGSNQHRYKCNMMFDEALDESFEHICDKLLNVLKRYCGPYAGYAALFETMPDGRQATKFTRDGINIVSALEFVNPIDSCTLSLLKTVGHGMEKMAGDGTTSAIILCIEALRSLRGKLRGKNIPYRKFFTAYSHVVYELVKMLDKQCIVPSNKAEIKGVAYHQAMTSSHQDEEMATIIAELFSSIPVKAWTNIGYRMEARETNDRFRLEYDDSSFSCQANLMDNLMFTDDLGTVSDVTGIVIVLPSEPITGSFVFDQALSIIHNLTPEDGPLTLISNQPDRKVYETLTKLYSTKFHEGCSFGIYWLPTNTGQMARCTDLDAIYVCAGYDRRVLGDKPLILENARLRWENSRLQIFDIAKYTEDGYHIDLLDEFSPLSKFIKMVDALIDSLTKELTTNIRNGETIRKLTALKNTLEFQRSGRVVIGGPIYEQIASKDVIDDVIRAVSISLREGCLLGGFRSMIPLLLNYRTQTNDACEQLIVDALVEVIADFNVFMYSECCSEEQLTDKLADIRSGVDSMDVITGKFTKFTADNLKSFEHPMILQSKTSYTEFLKRFGDVVPRMIYTTGISIPNAVDESINE